MLALLEMKIGKTHLQSNPFVLRIEPTNICNLHCPRCSCGINTDPREKGYIGLDDYNVILKQNQKTAVILRLDGNGEPTLHPKIFELIKTAKLYGYSISMSTNFNTDSCEDVKQFVDSGIDRIIVCIDGNTQASHERYRVGGNLSLVEKRLVNLIRIRKKLNSKKPFIEVQFLDWGYNHDEISLVRSKVYQWGVNKFQAICPDWAVTHARANPNKPRRCFWLWEVLSVDWALNYHSCTNAWTLPWPRLNAREVSSEDFWNHPLMVQARRYNIDKSAENIASDSGCHCNNCSDMLVVDRPPNYVCE